MLSRFSDIRMSEIDQGLEVITDENGQQLVKLVIVDENNEATGFAYVTPDEAAQILSGMSVY